MALDSVKIIAGVQWSLSKTTTGYAAAKQSDKHSVQASPAVATFDHLYSVSYPILAAGTQVVDLYAAYTDLAGNSISADTKANAVLVEVSGASGQITWEADATNGLSWFLSGTSPTLTIPASGFFLFYQPSAQVVSNTAKRILITNTGGVTLTVKLTFLKGT